MFVLTSDLHIRRSTPKCRTDNFLLTQEKKIRFICDLATSYNCPWLVAGDIFDKPRPGEFIKQWLISILSEYSIEIICIPGQHDLPNHQLQLLPDSALSVLAASGILNLITIPNKPIHICNTVIYGCPFGTSPKDIIIEETEETEETKILMWHHMVINNPLWLGQEADKATKIQKLYPEYDLILTGDNHTSFAINANGKWIVNPGSMLRMESDEIDREPCVFLYDNGKVEKINIPIEKDVFNETVIVENKRKSGRFDSLVEKLQIGFTSGRSFDEKMIYYLENNDIKQSVKDLILEALG